MSSIRPIRILIADDHAMLRSGLKNYIYAYEWMEAVGEAGTGAEAVAFCASQPVDVVLMDIMMPEMNGVEATRRIMALGKSIKIVILTSFSEQDLVEQALRAGATSYMLKTVNADDLARAIRAAHAGHSTLAPEAAEALIEATRQAPAPAYDLTQREKEVLGLLVKGRSNAEIAAELYVSNATIKYHLGKIFEKLGAKNRVEAATIALENNLAGRD